MFVSILSLLDIILLKKCINHVWRDTLFSDVNLQYYNKSEIIYILMWRKKN